MQRELFHLFGQPVYSYGFFLGIALVASWQVTFVSVRRAGIPVGPTKVVIFASILAAIGAARVLFFIANPDRWHGLSSFFALRDGGLVAYGGYIGGILTAYVGLRFIKVDFWRFSEHAAPNLALGLALVRIGCFLNGCDFGQPSEAPWSVAFPSESPAWRHHVAQGWIDPGAACSLSIHPTQLYASLYGWGLFGFLLWARTWPLRFEGQTLCLFLSLYGILRFLNEGLRDDPQRGSWGPLSTSQWISLAAVGIALSIAVIRWRTPPRTVRAAS